jgi:hypothetical protein
MFGNLRVPGIGGSHGSFDWAGAEMREFSSSRQYRGARGSLSPRLAEQQIHNNRETAASWERYAPHRRRLTDLVAGSVAGGGRLCVLGAGNANDLDLAALADRFTGLHLVDVDAAALGRAAARQGAGTRAKLHLHGGVELSGLTDQLDAWARRPPAPAALDALPGRTACRVAGALPGPFDLVVSACLLSQICRTCHRAFGDSPAVAPALGRVARAAVKAHLRVLATLAAPGAPCLLVTDAISSESYPLDELFTAEDGLDLLDELALRDLLFTGTSPHLIVPLLRQDPELRRLVERPRLRAPWLWQLSPTCTLLVYAIVFRRAG